MEPVEDILNKIPMALKNLGVSEGSLALVQNYVYNAILKALRDEKIRKRIEEEGIEPVIEYLAKL